MSSGVRGGSQRAFPLLTENGTQRSDGTVTWGNKSLLRVKGELTLPSVCDDLFAGPSLL